MRLSTPCLLAILIAGCHPSATIENTMPVANLQSYRTVALRVKSNVARGYLQMLQTMTVSKLQQACGFESIVSAGRGQADVLLDLNITSTGRGGTGIMRNPNLATVEALLVLTDGQNGDLMGTARIHGQSSGMVINNNPPEGEAMDVIAKAVVDLLVRSGCSGPRVARVEPAPLPPQPGNPNPGNPNPGNPNPGNPPGPGSAGNPPPPDETHRADAEALNDSGKVKLQGADMAGALSDFQKANLLLPDARYEFNVCLVFEAQQQWDQATTACRQARALSPEPRLVEKIDKRLELLKNHQ